MTHTATTQLTLPWGTTPRGELTREGTIVGAVMGTFAVFTFPPLGIVGIVLSCMGLDRIRRDDPAARTYLTWSWICFVPGTLIGTVLVLLGLWNLLGSLLG
jgi:protein-S-isoprenylcysteine O-methyltransferase Ste14